MYMEITCVVTELPHMHCWEHLEAWRFKHMAVNHKFGNVFRYLQASNNNQHHMYGMAVTTHMITKYVHSVKQLLLCGVSIEDIILFSCALIILHGLISIGY